MLVEWFSILVFLLLLTKWRELARVLRYAIALLVLDKGFVVLTQISIPVLIFLGTIVKNTKIGQIIIIGLILYQMFSYNAILYRLYSIKNNNYPRIINCYMFSLRKLKKLFFLLALVSALVIALISTLKVIELWFFTRFGVNFFINSICILITCVFFGVFTYFTYFSFILVVIEDCSLFKAIAINYKTIKKLPRSLLIQLTVLTALPGPLLNMQQLPINIAVYLWVLLGTSLSVVIYSESSKAMHNSLIK